MGLRKFLNDTVDATSDVSVEFQRRLLIKGYDAGRKERVQYAPGFYKVVWNGHNIVAKYCGEKHWWLTGTNEPFFPDAFSSIGEKIEFE